MADLNSQQALATSFWNQHPLIPTTLYTFLFDLISKLFILKVQLLQSRLPNDLSNNGEANDE
jgi:hypothetical protein